MKSLTDSFTGFSPEMPDFLFGLRFENTVDRQADNLIRYKKLISEPLFLLYESLLGTVSKISYLLEAKPSRCVSSPYTDRRFSPNVPLKEYMYIRFKQYGKESDIPGFYFDMGADFYGYGIRIYKQTFDGSERFRLKITGDPDKYFPVINAVSSAGFTAVGESYKKDRYPDIPGCFAKDILNKRRFYIEKTTPVGENVFSSALAAEISDGFIKLKEFYILMEDLS